MHRKRWRKVAKHTSKTLRKVAKRAPKTLRKVANMLSRTERTLYLPLYMTMFLIFFVPLQPYSSECDFFDAQILTRTATSTEIFTSKPKSAMKLRLCVDFVHSGFEAVAGLSENMAGLRIFCVHTLKSHSHLKH